MPVKSTHGESHRSYMPKSESLRLFLCKGQMYIIHVWASFQAVYQTARIYSCTNLSASPPSAAAAVPTTGAHGLRLGRSADEAPIDLGGSPGGSVRVT